MNINANFLITLVATIISFVIPLAIYENISKKNNGFNQASSYKTSSFLPIYATLSLMFIATYFISYDPTDFIFSLSLITLIASLLGAGAIYFADYLPQNKKKTSFLCSLVFATIAVTSMPKESVELVPVLPIWANQVILILSWSLYSFLYRYANTGDGTLAIHSIFVFLGIAILMLINSIPFLLGLYAFMTIGAFLSLFAYNRYPSRIKISANEATALGFLLFGVMSFCITEGNGANIVIFNMFFFVDVVLAFIYFIFVSNQKNQLIDNTCYKFAIKDGLNPAQGANLYAKALILMIFFGCFQAYSPNYDSLIVVSIMISLWFNYKFRTIPTPSQSFKDINAQILEELQDRVNEVKEIVSKEAKSDDNHNNEED